MKTNTLQIAILKILVLVLLAAGCASAQTISNLHVIDTSKWLPNVHSVVEIEWSTSPLWTCSGATGQPGNGQNCVEVIVSPKSVGSCSTGTIGAGAWVQPDDGYPIISPINVNVSGLQPNTDYYLCPQVWNGTGWNTSQIEVVTAPLPSPHPVPPTPPQNVTDTSYPAEALDTVSAAADLTNGSNQITVNEATGIVVGQVVTGYGIPDSLTTVTAISGTTVTLSNAATYTGIGIAVNFGYIVLPVDSTCNLTTAGGPGITTGLIAQATYAMQHQGSNGFFVVLPAGNTCSPSGRPRSTRRTIKSPSITAAEPGMRSRTGVWSRSRRITPTFRHPPRRAALAARAISLRGCRTMPTF